MPSIRALLHRQVCLSAHWLHYLCTHPSLPYHFNPPWIKSICRHLCTALDFSRAFDSVRHSAVLDKFSKLPLPDFIYNWIESFFRGHSHSARFKDQISGFQDLLASIIQGSCIGSASYVVTACDLHAVTSGNSMAKYADDTCLVIPAANFSSCRSEITNIDRWATINNLSLNRIKSAKIVFVALSSRRKSTVPPPNTFGFVHMDSIKVLGVLFTWKLSIIPHVNELLAVWARTILGTANFEATRPSNRHHP